jgi:hypothetical protein
MTQRGIADPIVIGRAAAAIVGDYICAKWSDGEFVSWLDALDRRAVYCGRDPSFKELGRFGAKLCKAADRRGRATSDQVKIWTVTRQEAQAGARYLGFFFLVPELSEYLSVSERQGFREVFLALVDAHSRRRGRPGLSREKAEAILARQRQEYDVGRRTWTKALAERLHHENELGATLRNPVPSSVFKLLR